MFKLDSTRTLEVSLDATVTSSALQGTVSYIDMPQQTSANRMTEGGAIQTFTVDDDTETTAIPAPSIVGTIREWDGLNVYNADSATAVLSVKINTSGTYTTLRKASLDPGDTLFVSMAAGWQKHNT